MRKLVLVAVVVLSVNSFGIGHSEDGPLSGMPGAGALSWLFSSRPETSDKVKAKMAEVRSVCGPRPESSSTASSPAVPPSIPYARD